jgi:hypothetical protein
VIVILFYYSTCAVIFVNARTFMTKLQLGFKTKSSSYFGLHKSRQPIHWNLSKDLFPHVTKSKLTSSRQGRKIPRRVTVVVFDKCVLTDMMYVLIDREGRCGGTTNFVSLFYCLRLLMWPISDECENAATTTTMQLCPSLLSATITHQKFFFK